MIWDELTSPQIGDLDKNTPVLLPIAATEQHGPHLPLATDRMIGEHFAKRLNEEIPDGILILPTVSIGCSDHHMGFAGTLTYTHDTFARQVREIVNSVIRHGFHKIIIQNSHGGNLGVGQVILEQLGFEHPDCQFVSLTWWRIASEALMGITETGFGGVGHACEFETSLMMLIAPSLVDHDKIAPGANQKTFDWAEGDMLRGSAASYFRTMKQMTLNGVFGDPTKATLEKGQQITDCVVQALRKIVIDLTDASKPV